MKAISKRINTGAACGTWVTEIRTDDGQLRGFIRVVNIDWTPVLGMSTYFAAHQCWDDHYDVKMFGTLAQAYAFLGVSIDEMDKMYLGDHPYDEK